MNEKIGEQQVRDRAIRLFTFLLRLTELRTKNIRTFDQYERVIWFSDIPREPGCYCIAWGPRGDDEQAEVWLEIKKPCLTAPPTVPETLRPWLDPREVEDSSREIPELRERITVTVRTEADDAGEVAPRTVIKELAESPEIRTLWQRYVEDKWHPWAEVDRGLQKVQKAYTDLFSIYQRQERLGEAYEVVLGLGCLTWRTPNGHEVRRHIVAAQTSLTFDAAHGVITLGPAGEGAKPTLEQDMLEPQERPAVAEQRAVERLVAEIGDSLWGRAGVHDALRAWVHAVSPRGEFNETLVPPGGIGLDPMIHFAPAVILRKRTERNLLRVFQEIVQQLQNGKAVPVGVARLVTIVDDGTFGEDDAAAKDRVDTTSPPVEDIYFPLPANDEQLEIVRKLSARQGVLVEGPPGTGKSQTIANLVCHLLATGQRVLVTSHTARALRVLRDKLPREIADLCVILLGDDLTALQALEDSVRGITGRYETWREERNRQLIAELERKLDEARRAEASTLAELRVAREAETYYHPRRFGTYEGTAQSIAIRLREEESRYSWLSIRPKEADDPPLSDPEALELIRLLREIDTDQEQELAKDSVDPGSLASPSEFASLVGKETEARLRYEAAEGRRNHPAYGVLARAPSHQRKDLVERLSDLSTACEPLARHTQSWVGEATHEVLTDQVALWQELFTNTKKHLQIIGDRAREVSERQISGLGERKRSVVKVQAEALLQHLEKGGRLGFGPFRPKVVKESIYLIKRVRVDGHLCDNPQTLRHLLQWIEIAARLDALRRYWSPCMEPPDGSFAAKVAGYRNACELLEKILDLQRKVMMLKEVIAALPGLQEPTWHDADSLRAMQEATDAVRLEEELAQARSRLDALETNLRRVAINPNVHPAISQAVQNVQERDEQGYAKTYQVIYNLARSRERLQRRRALLHRLEVAAPGLASQVTSSFADRAWDSRIAEFNAAWNWARADHWLIRLNDAQAQEQLSSSLESHRHHLQELLCHLAAARAWGHCLAGLTEHQRQHLRAWAKAVQRIGKGKGKYVSMHRKAAREHMERCRSAIPAWVMPIYRIAETVHPGTDTYDVVIIDEASQSGPEALFLQYLAKKIVVVGDDKQISPEFVGIDREDVELLRRQLIDDLPHSDALGVGNSFFDQAEIRYSGRIRLREHFRCMPEIIQFSNNLCYQSEPLLPLRQYGTARLTPVVVTCHVPEGYQRGQSPRVENPPEAEAVADQIKRCCEDPAYEGKTMGVISLLGEQQARLIEKLLLEKVGPEEMEKRHLVCGDAYAFQGDERDIMFLSLVSGPKEGGHIGTLASQRDERRFNVAASRAKDQMWLFHTATLNDLSSKDLRYSLLQYCQNPKVEQAPFPGLDIQALRTKAATVNRGKVSPPSPFGSWFEVDVFLRIIDRGYRVLPQFEIAGYFIDLLVEGMRGRLAVECDGEVWHGADRYESDMSRQRMLERCELTFWRVGGGAFYRNPDAALEGLWNTLQRLGVHPTS